jgi:hypothetical protein
VPAEALYNITQMHSSFLPNCLSIATSRVGLIAFAKISQPHFHFDRVSPSFLMSLPLLYVYIAIYDKFIFFNSPLQQEVFLNIFKSADYKRIVTAVSPLLSCREGGSWG